MPTDQIPVVAVVGACSLARHHRALEIARSMHRVIVTARRLAAVPDPVEEVLTLSRRGATAGGVVIEVPVAGRAADLITSLMDEGGVRLEEVVCVIDAGAGLEEWFREDAPPPRTAGGCAPLSRPLTVMAQLELASTLMVVNWEGLAADELRTLLALVHHLCPLGDFRFQEFASMEPSPTAAAYQAEVARPGWAHLIGGTFEALIAHPRVDAFRYECIRPFHLGRLHHLIHQLTGSRRFGTLIRSAGYCRTAPDPNVTEIWNQVGPVLYATPVDVDEDLGHVLDPWADTQPMALGQDLAFIGLDLEREALVTALDAAVLTDAEFMAGPRAWKKQLKPFL